MKSKFTVEDLLKFIKSFSIIGGSSWIYFLPSKTVQLSFHKVFLRFMMFFHKCCPQLFCRCRFSLANLHNCCFIAVFKIKLQHSTKFVLSFNFYFYSFIEFNCDFAHFSPLQFSKAQFTPSSIKHNCVMKQVSVTTN